MVAAVTARHVIADNLQPAIARYIDTSETAELVQLVRASQGSTKAVRLALELAFGAGYEAGVMAVMDYAKTSSGA